MPRRPGQALPHGRRPDGAAPRPAIRRDESSSGSSAPDEPELERRLAGLRGEIELPIPAASAVKIGGERAYRLARRGVEVEMPLRRSTVYALDVISYTGDPSDRVRDARPARQLAARTCGRSRKRSAVTAARCGERRSGRSPSRTRCRRTRSSRARLLPEADVLERVGGARVIVAHRPEELEPARRAVAIGTFDGVHRGHRRVIEAARGGAPPLGGRDVRPASAHAARRRRSSC